MRTILVANPKGGSGKTTLATNLAGWLAGKRQRVALADEDPQRSATEWLARRPELFPRVLVAEGGRATPPDWLVVDSPAGVHGEALRDAVRRADMMLVPISPSIFDMAATEQFLSAIAGYKAVSQGDLAVGLIGMRVDARTLAAGELDEFVKALDFPRVTTLRDTQTYVHCARRGLSVFDLPRSRAEHDWDQWRPLTRWVAKHAKAHA